MVRAGVVGITGYTGMELARILLQHPEAELTYATSRSRAGEAIGGILPHLAGRSDLVVEKFDPARAADASDFVFVCLPHGEAMDTAAALFEEGARTVDLSADFRLRDSGKYARWYTEHRHPHLLEEAVNGFPELYRSRIREAKLVANPGCYPTSVVLGLLPLVEQGLVDTGSLIADAKSGVSGAGREPKPHMHFPEVQGNFSVYSPAGFHRHISEMEQELSLAGGEEIGITFTPQLLPVSRGILSTLYASPVGIVDVDTLQDIFRTRYGDEPFVRIVAPGDPLPGIKEVAGTNVCAIAPLVDRNNGRILIVSCIDNLVKGAAGQAVQNMNIMAGIAETKGLDHLPLIP